MTSFDYTKLFQKNFKDEKTLSDKAGETLDDLLNFLMRKIIVCADKIIQHMRTKTLDSRAIQTAVRCIFPNELTKHAISEAVKFITRYCSSTSETETKTEKTGLTFNINKIAKNVNSITVLQRKGFGAMIYLTAVLEYIAVEIIECALQNVTKNKVTSKHIFSALEK